MQETRRDIKFKKELEFGMCSYECCMRVVFNMSKNLLKANHNQRRYTVNILHVVFNISITPSESLRLAKDSDVIVEKVNHFDYLFNKYMEQILRLQVSEILFREEFTLLSTLYLDGLEYLPMTNILT